MKEFSADDIVKLWPHWRPDMFSRFCAEVFRSGPKPEMPYDEVEFLCMAIDRWFAHVCPQFNESQRHYVIKHLAGRVGQSPFPEYAVDEDPIEGFFISVFDDRWVTWGGAWQFLDLRTFEQLTALPQPHIWVTILGVTPMYFRLLKDLERRDATSSSQPAI